MRISMWTHQLYHTRENVDVKPNIIILCYSPDAKISQRVQGSYQYAAASWVCARYKASLIPESVSLRPAEA